MVKFVDILKGGQNLWHAELEDPRGCGKSGCDNETGEGIERFKGNTVICTSDDIVHGTHAFLGHVLP